MDTKALENTEEVSNNNTWIPKVITGGKGTFDPPSDGTDWLSPLEIYTTFLVQGKKDTSFMLGQFTVIHKGTKGRLMLHGSSDKPEWFDPIRFCRDYRLYEILQTGEQYRKEREANAIARELNNGSD